MTTAEMNVYTDAQLPIPWKRKMFSGLCEDETPTVRFSPKVIFHCSCGHNRLRMSIRIRSANKPMSSMSSSSSSPKLIMTSLLSETDCCSLFRYIPSITPKTPVTSCGGILCVDMTSLLSETDCCAFLRYIPSNTKPLSPWPLV